MTTADQARLELANAEGLANGLILGITTIPDFKMEGAVKVLGEIVDKIKKAQKILGPKEDAELCQHKNTKAMFGRYAAKRVCIDCGKEL